MTNFTLEPEERIVDTLYNVYYHYCTQEGELGERALEGLSLIWIRFPQLLYKSQDFITKALGNTETHFSKVKILETFRAFFLGVERRLLEVPEEDAGPMLSITNMYVNRLIVLAIDPDVEVREIGIDVLTSIHG